MLGGDGAPPARPAESPGLTSRARVHPSHLTWPAVFHRMRFTIAMWEYHAALTVCQTNICNSIGPCRTSTARGATGSGVAKCYSTAVMVPELWSANMKDARKLPRRICVL